MKISHIIESIPIIDPGNKFKLIWDFTIMTLFLLLFFAYPIQLSFDIKTYLIDRVFENNELMMYFFEILILTFLSCDILMKFNTAYYKKGRLIKQKNDIIKNYIKNNFINDLLTFIPFLISNYITTFHEELSELNKFLKYFQIFIFFKLVEVLRQVHLLREVLRLSNKGSAIFQLIELAVSLFLFCHLMACIWHGVSYYGPYEDNFLKFSNVFFAPWKTRYFRCLFVTVNPGKIEPRNDFELIFGFFALLATSGSIGFMISSIHNIMRTLSKSEETKRF